MTTNHASEAGRCRSCGWVGEPGFRCGDCGGGPLVRRPGAVLACAECRVTYDVFRPATFEVPAAPGRAPTVRWIGACDEHATDYRRSTIRQIPT